MENCTVTEGNVNQVINQFPKKECSGCDALEQDDFGLTSCRSINRVINSK